MGISPSFPVKRAPICFNYHKDYTSAGKKRSNVTQVIQGQPHNVFEELTEELFAALVEKRTAIMVAEQKLRDVNNERILQRCPNITVHQLADLRGQFQTFDINQDGLIDFKELCKVLDELGDTSDAATREQCFTEMDSDKSGAVDFEEFVAVINDVIGGRSKLGAIGQLCKEASESANTLRKMSVMQQIETGLF